MGMGCGHRFESKLLVEFADVVGCVAVDQAAVVLVDHLGGAVSHLVGEPFNRNGAAGEQLAGVGVAAVVGTAVFDSAGGEVAAPAVFDLVIVVVGLGAGAMPEPLEFFFFVGAVVSIEDVDALGGLVFDVFDLLLQCCLGDGE